MKTKVYGPSPQIDADRLHRIVAEARLSHDETAAHFGVSIPTLTRTMRALGLRSVKGRGSPMEKNPFWKGGRTKDADGYILVKSPDHPHANNNGYVREHRLVMEKKIGRYLLPSEVVHHDDEDHSNNDPSNLFLHASNGEHIREHMREGSIPHEIEDIADGGGARDEECAGFGEAEDGERAIVIAGAAEGDRVVRRTEGGVRQDVQGRGAGDAAEIAGDRGDGDGAGGKSLKAEDDRVGAGDEGLGGSGGAGDGQGDGAGSDGGGERAGEGCAGRRPRLEAPGRPA